MGREMPSNIFRKIEYMINGHFKTLFVSMHTDLNKLNRNDMLSFMEIKKKYMNNSMMARWIPLTNQDTTMQDTNEIEITNRWARKKKLAIRL